MAGTKDKSRHEAKKAARNVRRTWPRATSLLEQSRRSADENSRARRTQGKAMRGKVPLASHAEFAPAPDRPDPVALLQSQDDVRIASRVPIRFGRNGGITLFLLPRSCDRDGGRPCQDADDRPARPGLRRNRGLAEK